MACLPELTCALYADGELSASEREAADRHLVGCARCRALVGALAEENQVLTAALEDEPAAARAPRPAWRALAAAGAVAAAVATLLQVGQGWSARSTGPDWLGVAVDLALLGVHHAATLSAVVTGAAVATMLALTAAGAALLVRRPAIPRGQGFSGWGPWGLGGLVLAGALLGAPASGGALESRTGARVRVAAGESVEGPLLVASDAARIDGTVEGDLIALAGHLEVRGAVRGDLIFAGRRLDLLGSVDGHVYALAGEVRVSGVVARSLYGLTREARVMSPGRVGGDLLAVGREVDLGGEVTRGAWILAARVRVAGSIGRDLAVRADQVDVVAPARIGGTLAARAAEPDALRIEPGVVVGSVRPPAKPPARWTLGPVLWPAARFFAALATGVVALALAPRTFHGSTEALGAFGRSLAVGLAALVAAPVTVLLLALTLVGLPLALTLLATYLGALYGAPLVVGAFVGRTLLGSTGHGVRAWLPALVVGLGIVTVLRAVPVVGAAVSLVVVCLGLGGIARQVLRSFRGPAGTGG